MLTSYFSEIQSAIKLKKEHIISAYSEGACPQFPKKPSTKTVPTKHISNCGVGYASSLEPLDRQRQWLGGGICVGKGGILKTQTQILLRQGRWSVSRDTEQLSGFNRLGS